MSKQNKDKDNNAESVVVTPQLYSVDGSKPMSISDMIQKGIKGKSFKPRSLSDKVLKKKKAYESSKPEHMKTFNKIIETGEDLFGKNNAGNAGINLKESGSYGTNTVDNDIVNYSDDIDFENLVDDILSEFKKDSSDTYELFSIFKKAMDDENYFDSEFKFTNLVQTLNSTDLLNKKELIRELAKLYSKTLKDSVNAGSNKDVASDVAISEAYKFVELQLSNNQNKVASLNKLADLSNNPELIAESVVQIVRVLFSRFSMESRHKAFPNLKNKLEQFNVVEISNKKSPGGAAIGSAITLIKNILNGKDATFINLVLSAIKRRL